MWIEIGSGAIVVDNSAEVLLPDYMVYVDGSVDWRGAASAKDAIVAFGRDVSDNSYLIVRADGLIMTASIDKLGEGWPAGDHQIRITDGGFTITITVGENDSETDAGYIIDRAMSTGVTIDLATLDRYLGRA